jgi:hypothetical protein
MHNCINKIIRIWGHFFTNFTLHKRQTLTIWAGLHHTSNSIFHTTYLMAAIVFVCIYNIVMWCQVRLFHPYVLFLLITPQLGITLYTPKMIWKWQMSRCSIYWQKERVPLNCRLMYTSCEYPKFFMLNHDINILCIPQIPTKIDCIGGVMDN